MNKAKISNALRKLGILYPLDRLRYRFEKNKNDQANQRFRKENPTVSLPPDYLMYESFQVNYAKYYFGGKESAENIFDLISKHIDLKGKKVLDWGCGPARIVRHMPEVSGNQADFYGTDYNGDSIAWCKKYIKNVAFNHNGLKAKLPYSGDTFDAIYGISIFTHLSEEMHFSWFEELKRVLRPSGVMLFTTQGENFKSKLSELEKSAFNAGKLVVRGNVKEGHRTYSAFHPNPFLESLFSGVDLLEKIVKTPENHKYVPQDTWILRKK